MKNLKFSQFQYVLAISMFTLVSTLFLRKADAQQQNAQWSFYLAFEDAIGAKDTIWYLLDTAATEPWGISGLYGEVPIETDSVNFQVWFLRIENPTARYNTFMNNIADAFAAYSTELHAENFELPITASWDSSLFTANVLYEYGGYPINIATLDNEYLFMNGGSETGWDMTQDDHVELPYFWWGSSNQFPLYPVWERGPLETGVGIKDVEKADFSIYPNPASDYVLLSFRKMVTAQLKMYDLNGRLVRSSSISSDRKRINVDDLESGLYFIEIQDARGSLVKKLMVK